MKQLLLYSNMQNDSAGVELNNLIELRVKYERLEDFADQLASRFPRAKRLPYTHPPDDDVKQSADQYLQIFLVQPVPNIPEQLKPPKERDLLTYFFFVRIIQN